MLEAFTEILVDRFIADFGKKGEVTDTNFLLSTCFIDGLSYDRLRGLFGSGATSCL